MKKILVVVFLLVAAFCSLFWAKKLTNKKPPTKFKVTGSIMQTMSYCGGARPTAEMLKRFATPAGIPFGKLFIKKDGINKDGAPVIDSMRADENGNFSVNLKPGNYCVVEEWKTKPFKLPLNNSNQTVDAACYRKLYDACDYQLTITDSNITDLKLVFHQPCFFHQPCIAYTGALPP